MLRTFAMMFFLGMSGGPTTVWAQSDLLEAALETEDSTGRKLLRRQYLQWSAEARAELSSLEPAQRAEALLKWMHRGRLKQYEAKATTLKEIFREGRFNCVSSALLYNLLAHDLQLETRAELLPTHARSVVRLGGDWRMVETTVKHGFAPDLDQQQEILNRVALAVDPEADEDGGWVAAKGERHQSQALVAVTWGNLGLFAQQAGQPDQAERLFARAERVATSARMRRSLAQQRAIMLGQLAMARWDRGDADEAIKTVDRALGLSDLSEEVRRFLQSNRAVFVQVRTRQDVERGKPERVRRALEAGTIGRGHSPVQAAKLRAFAWGELGRYHMLNKEWTQARRAFEQGLEAPHLLPESFLEGLRSNLEQTVQAEATKRASDGQLDAALARVEAPERRRRLHEVAVNQAAKDRDEERLRALTTRCLQAHPDSEFCRSHRIAHLQGRLKSLLEPGACDGGQEVWAELTALQPAAAFAIPAKVACWSRTANRAYNGGRYPAAVDAMERALTLQPDSEVVRRNLKVVFGAWAEKAESHRCKARRAELQERARSLQLPKCPAP